MVRIPPEYFPACSFTPSSYPLAGLVDVYGRRGSPRRKYLFTGMLPGLKSGMASRNHLPITQIQETGHISEASESVPHSEDNVQVSSVSLEPVPEPAQTQTSVSEPVKDAQTPQEAGKPEDGEAGPAPPSHSDQQPSTSVTIGSTQASSETEPASGGNVEKEKEREKDKESSSVTLPLTIASLRKRTRRRDERSITEEGKSTASHTTEESPSLSEAERKPKKTKASLLAKITHIFTSCVAPSPRTHVVDLDEGPSSQGRADQKDPEKHSTKDVEVAEQQPSREASSSTSTGMEISRTLSSLCFLTPSL